MKLLTCVKICGQNRQNRILWCDSKSFFLSNFCQLTFATHKPLKIITPGFDFGSSYVSEKAKNKNKLITCNIGIELLSSYFLK